MADNQLCFNGINGTSGEYLFQDLPPETIARVAKGETIDESHLEELSFWNRLVKQRGGTRGVSAGIDANELEQTGWGVIFAHDADPNIREALNELLEFRQQQATRQGDYYFEFLGSEGYQPGESKRQFLSRHGAGPGPADPENIPYYLLIVGDPESIPFRFQYQLDVQYAVGRLWFEGNDALNQYSQYARSVVAAETGQVVLPRTAAFFGVQNQGDRATELSSTRLVKPLADQLPKRMNSDSGSAWGINTFLADKASKQNLAQLLGGTKTPSLLFTASHGMGFENGDSRQLPHQGALLCQDWPGRKWKGSIPTDHYFSADDVGDDANLLGLIAFHFACYGAGTPRQDEFSHQTMSQPKDIAPRAFLARLPQRLLGHPQGGALAVIGHVERAWAYSFVNSGAVPQLQSFQSTLQELMQGSRVGAALEYFNCRYAELSTDLSSLLEEIKFGKDIPDFQVASLWTENNDARSYVVLGDPAVRIPLQEPDQILARPRLDRVSLEPGLVEESANNQPHEPTENANNETADVATSVDRNPPTGDDVNWFANQISETEKRFAQRQNSKPVHYEAPPGSSPFLQRNDHTRLRRRLANLGLSDAVTEQIVGGGITFRPISSSEDAPQTADVLLERVLGRNDMVDAHFLEAGFRSAQPVGRIRILSESGQKLGFGTGSLIGPGLLLTNNHVLNSRSRTRRSVVEFGVEDRPADQLMLPTEFEFMADNFFVTDKELDFTLIAVSPVNNQGELLEHFGWNTPSLDDDPILNEEYVNIIQHPGGRPKQVALRDNQVTDVLDDFLHYQSDTEPGSSGAPVFNDQWEIVALHHSGVPKRDQNNKILARDGSVWSPWMGDQLIDWIANEGVRLSRILAKISDVDLNEEAARMRDLLFELRQPCPPSRSIVIPAADNSDNSDTAATQRQQREVSVAFQIPITISVSMNESDENQLDAQGTGNRRQANGEIPIDQGGRPGDC